MGRAKLDVGCHPSQALQGASQCLLHNWLEVPKSPDSQLVISTIPGKRKHMKTSLIISLCWTTGHPQIHRLFIIILFEWPLEGDSLFSNQPILAYIYIYTIFPFRNRPSKWLQLMTYPSPQTPSQGSWADRKRQNLFWSTAAPRHPLPGASTLRQPCNKHILSIPNYSFEQYLVHPTDRLLMLYKYMCLGPSWSLLNDGRWGHASNNSFLE